MITIISIIKTLMETGFKLLMKSETLTLKSNGFFVNFFFFFKSENLSSHENCTNMH